MRLLSFLFILIAAFSLSDSTAQSFYRVYPGQGYNSFQELVAVSDNRFVFITSTTLYEVDGTGNINWQKELKEGIYSSLESIIQDQEGNYWIASTVFTDLSNSRKVLYKLTAGGQIISTTRISSPSTFEYLKLLPGNDNKLFLAYQNRDAEGYAFVHLSLRDKNGTEIWTKQVTDTLFNSYSIKKGPAGSADIYYIARENRQGRVVSVSETSAINVLPIQIPGTPGFVDYTADFCRMPDGSFVFAGSSEKESPAFSDAFACKTDATGQLIWLKRIPVRRGDAFLKISALPDGFITAGTASQEDWGNDQAGDIIISRLDADGNPIWIKAFGSEKTDYPRALSIINNTILIGGQSSYPGQTTSIPMLCRTDLQGNIQDNKPFQLQPASAMKKLPVAANNFPKTFVQAAPGADHQIITAGNFLDPQDDAAYPFLICHDPEGQQHWYKQISSVPEEMKLMKKIRPGQYIAITERSDIFQNLYKIYFFDESGTITGTSECGANTLKDAIATNDGGVLLTGSLDISFVNYETLLVKLGADGNLQWQKTIGDLQLWETGRSIIETPEHDFLIAGNRQKEFDILSAVYLLKIDQNGNKRWSKTIAEGIATDLAHNLTLTTDQKYLIFGTTQPYSTLDKNTVLIKTDENGNLIWKKERNLYLQDEGRQVLTIGTGGFLLAGTTGPKAGALETLVYVAKTDAEGNTYVTDYYGREGLQTSHPQLMATSWGDTLLFGTTEEKYGEQYIFFVNLSGQPNIPPPPVTSELIIFPNPAGSSATLQLESAETGLLSIALYDQTGKPVRRQNADKTTATFRQTIDLSGLAGGLYYVTVHINGTNLFRKLLTLGQ